jgi:hypothetical protein
MSNLFDTYVVIGPDRSAVPVVVPKATWHTAKISTPTALLFVTPGEATQNRDI